MMHAAQLRALGAAAIVAAGVWAWFAWWPSDERAIRRRLGDLAATVKDAAPEGIVTVARAAQIGSYFTPDVVIDLGQGSGPISGRESLIAAAARLQPRSDDVTLEFDEVSVEVNAEAGVADVALAAVVTRRNTATGERATDARELQLGMTKDEGVWRIARVAAVDALRRE